MKKWTSLLLALVLALSLIPSAFAEEPYTVKVMLIKQTKLDDLDRVVEAINEITLEKINCKFEPIYVDSANFVEQVTLMLASGEELGLIETGGWLNYASEVANGMLLPLDDLLATYAPSVIENVPEEVLSVPKVNGKLYCVPTCRDWATEYTYFVRKDLVEKYNIDVNSVHGYEDLTDIFKVITEGEGIPAVSYQEAGKSLWTNMLNTKFDYLDNYLGVLPYDGTYNIVNLWESETTKYYLNLIRQWYLAGYIPADLATAQTTSQEMVKAGVVAGYLAKWKPGFDEKESLVIGCDMVSIRFSDVMQTSNTICNICYAIPVTCSQPEKAAQMLDIMWGNADYMNLMSFGFEGEHYVFEDKDAGVITYPEGISSENAKYSPQSGWMYGNQFLGYVFSPAPGSTWEDTIAFNNSAISSPGRSLATGIVFDMKAVKTQVSACQNVLTKYERALGNGSVDPDEYMPRLIDELKAAGIDDIIAEKQAQLNAWLAAKE